MPALVAGIHVLNAAPSKDVDGRNSPAMTNYGALWMSAPADVLYLTTPADVAKW
jgi:hypothetical protein